MTAQTFTLDDEMSTMLGLCDKLGVVWKVEIYNEGSGIEKMFLISDPSRTPNWIMMNSLPTLVDVVAERKLGKLAQKR